VLRLLPDYEKPKKQHPGNLKKFLKYLIKKVLGIGAGPKPGPPQKHKDKVLPLPLCYILML
jgi:hypothetical protein